MPLILVVVVLLVHLGRTVESARDAPAFQPSPGCTCPCIPEQQGAGQMISQLVDAATQKHVLIKVRLLPTAVSTLLRTVKQDVTGTRGPQPWVAALINSTTVATAGQLDLPASALRVTLEASLGSGLSVPLAPPSRQQAAVDALADFYEQVTGSTSLLVGLNMVQTPGPKQHPTGDSSSSSASKQQGSVLALATLNGPFGDLAHVLHMGDVMQHRCQELFQLGAVLNISEKGSNGCSAWLSERYSPLLHPQGAAHDSSTSKAAMPAAAAALKAAVPPAESARAQTAQAVVALPMEVNIKLSMKLSLTGPSTDPDALISRARSWLASPALDQMLQLHGLHIGAGSPAHLVTLLSAPGGIGGYKGVDEVIEVKGSNPAAADAGAGASSSHHDAQPELGLSHSRSSVYSASGMSAWGRLQPHELGPLVAGPADAATLALPPHAAVGPSSSQAAGDDEIGRRTVLGAIIGAVLGSAAAGAALALFVASAARRRRAVQLQQGSSGCNTCVDAGDSAGRDAAQGSSSGGHRRRSRKRYLKYLPSMSAQHLLPVTAPPASPMAGSSRGASSTGTGGTDSNSAVTAGEEAASSAVGTAGQQLHNGSAPAQGGGTSCPAPGFAVQQGPQPLAEAPEGLLLLESSTVGTALQAQQQQQHYQQDNGRPEVTQQHSEPLPMAAVQQQQRQQQPQQQLQPRSHIRSRLLLGLGLLRSVASDPLMQAPSRSRRADVRQHSGGLWAAEGDAAPALTRQELCSDSVSSAARLDMLQTLQRSASAVSSEDASVTDRSISGSSMGRGMGSAASDPSSSCPGSPGGGCSSPPAAPEQHSSRDSGCMPSIQPPQAPSWPANRLEVPTSNAEQISSEQMGAQQHAPAAPLPVDAGLDIEGGRQLRRQQQPPTAWSNPCGPSVAAASVQAQGQHSHALQDEDSAHSSLTSSNLAAAQQAVHSAHTSAATATGRPALLSSPFLQYDFAALEHK